MEKDKTACVEVQANNVSPPVLSESESKTMDELRTAARRYLNESVFVVLPDRVYIIMSQ